MWWRHRVCVDEVSRRAAKLAGNCWSNNAGPRPVRSRQHPLGFPWVEGRALARADQGNRLLEVTLDAILAAHRGSAKFLLEHPEDLGRTARSRPASIWQLDRVSTIAAETSATTSAKRRLVAIFP